MEHDRNQIDIRLKLNADDPWMELQVEEGTTLEDLVCTYRDRIHIGVLAARTCRT